MGQEADYLYKCITTGIIFAVIGLIIRVFMKKYPHGYLNRNKHNDNKK
jgi:hypothetical protein